MLVIDPEDCIDCRVCIPECPVEAIYAPEEVPAGQQQYFGVNADLAKRWPVITRKKAPLPDADTWAHVIEKAALLDRRGEDERE